VAEKVGAEFTIHKEGAALNQRNEMKKRQKDTSIDRLRKGVKRRYRDLTGEAERLMKRKSRNQRGKFEELLQDCRTILDAVEGREKSTEGEFWNIYMKYKVAKAPRKGETASLWYKMRLFTLRLWDQSPKILRKTKPSRRITRSHR
jgi:hypothetical protein